MDLSHIGGALESKLSFPDGNIKIRSDPELAVVLFQLHSFKCKI